MTGDDVEIKIGEGFDPAVYEPEELDPALLPYVAEVKDLGTCIRHPYVYSIMHWPALNRMVNQSYRAKVAAVAEALAARKWSRYIRLHERAYRVNALTEIQDRMTDQEYWSHVASTWIDSENIVQVRDMWHALWQNPRPGRTHMMTRGERKALAGLPTRLTIYRGVAVQEGVQGLSWTLTRDVAVRLAKRYGTGPGPTIYIARGEVNKRFVLAHFLERNEAEIVVLPEHVRKITIEAMAALRRR